MYGGDINEVYLLKTNQGNLVLKINSNPKLPHIFEVEAKGLKKLQSSRSFQVPEVFGLGRIGNHFYLLMDYIEPGKKSNDFWEDFGRKLALLHQNTRKEFGLDHDNYIGSLLQNNSSTAQDAAEFYIANRLKPQFDYAASNGFHFDHLDIFFQKIKALIPNEPASLIHGDLWNGNYLVSDDGKPILIDPAISYASREMDLAMMQLFGGFPTLVFEAYQKTFPLQEDAQERLKIWQLYYLLVHLNLFGTSYLSSVKACLKTYR